MLVPAVGTETSLLMIPSPPRENGFGDLEMITVSPEFGDFNTTETVCISNSHGLSQSAAV
jgi:hypothetical protein